MKKKMLKKLVCVSGFLFMTFPAWSAVPSSLLPNDGNWNQAPAIADVENPLFQGDMILAKGGGSGGGGGGNGGGSGGGIGGGGGNGGGDPEAMAEMVRAVAVLEPAVMAPPEQMVLAVVPAEWRQWGQRRIRRQWWWRRGRCWRWRWRWRLRRW